MQRHNVKTVFSIMHPGRTPRFCPTTTMKKRTLNNLMAFGCFGPIALLTIPPGLLLLPVWIQGSLRGQYDTYDQAGPGDYIWPLASLVLGIAGLVGLLSTLSLVNSPNPRHQGLRVTRFAVVCGVLGIVLFNVKVGGINPVSDPIMAAIYWILPLFGTAYFLDTIRNLPLRE